MLGDADNNNKLESPDATVIQRYVAKMANPGLDLAIMLRNGDVDGDGKLTVTDATFIQRKLARQNVPYPIGEYVNA